jgi:CheY-like chemotaxis protein
MDIHLPGGSGLALTRMLKSNPESRRVKIVAIFAYASTGERIAAGCTFLRPSVCRFHWRIPDK